MELGLAISVICAVISVASFVLSRKDKATKDTKEEAKEDAKHYSKQELIEYRLNKIDQQLEKILDKLDMYDKEIDDKIKEAMKRHVLVYHNKKGGE